MNNGRRIWKKAQSLAQDPRHSAWLGPICLATDAVLTGLIIWRVPYTEIDWTAYMQQIGQYRAGERDYAMIKGQTGPLVYPAGHVIIFNALYDLTDQGKNIPRAQAIFALLYLGALAMVMACYRKANAPPYLFPLLILSKRLHSIFVLRLFNDCFAVLGLFAGINLFQHGMYTFGSLAMSLAMSVKMTVLLALPAIALALLLDLPFRNAINNLLLMGQVQVLLAVPFIKSNWRSYVGRAFDFGRQFKFKWTVNWRFVDEDVFLSPIFARTLLGLNVMILGIFAITRWIAPSGLGPIDLMIAILKPSSPQNFRNLPCDLSPRHYMTTILSSIVIGLFCARSLHYQFFAYLAWATPFLLWTARFPPWLIVTIWLLQEFAWNVYPSTNLSSIVVVGCLGVQVIGVWWGTSGSDNTPVTIKAEDKTK